MSAENASDLAPNGAAHPSFGEALRFWVKLGFVNFGGPTGQIAVMHTELVDRRRWISNGRFLHALNYCMLLPGPEAQQLAIYVGWLLHGTPGGLVAGLFFIIPGFFLMLVLSWLTAVHGDVAWVNAIFAGLGAAVVGIVTYAMIRVANRALKNGVMVGVAIFSFLALTLVGIPFPFLMVVAGLVGWFGGARWPEVFSVIKEEEADVDGDEVDAHILHDAAETPKHAQASGRRALGVLVFGLAIWWVPLLLVASVDFGTPVFAQQAFFFSKVAIVTFGGAYAVLAYINIAAVSTYGWATSSQMVTGLGLAESTPGPLILVTQFVGFLGAYSFHGDLSPVVAGVLGSIVVVWATFAPCFLWIFLGAPYIEKLRGHVRLSSALSTITAAVVGVIGSLAVNFAVHTLFTETTPLQVFRATLAIPVVATFDLFAFTVALITFVGMLKYKWHVLWVIAGAAVAGLLASFVG